MVPTWAYSRHRKRRLPTRTSANSAPSSNRLRDRLGLAFERGDEVFQLQMPLYEQQAIIVAMVGSSTAGRASDPSAELNRVISEGWELLSSGQNVAIKGQVTGYYLFRRAPDKRRQP